MKSPPKHCAAATRSPAWPAGPPGRFRPARDWSVPTADTPDGLDAVAEQHWDAVLDVSRQPGQVRRAVAALAGTAEHFTFVSSCSVYADHGSPGADETAGLLPPLESDVMTSPDVYGAAKVACENAARNTFGPDRSLIVRPGLIAGPGDSTDRTGYWPLRFARPVADDGPSSSPMHRAWTPRSSTPATSPPG